MNTARPLRQSTTVMRRGVRIDTSKRMVFENDYVEGLALEYRRSGDFGVFFEICRHSKNLMDSIIRGSGFAKQVSFHDLVAHLFLHFDRWITKWTPGAGTLYSYLSTCYTWDTRVLLADGSWMAIGKIVDECLPVDVMSFDTVTNQITVSRVTGWINNPAVRDEWRKVNVTPPGSNERSFYVTGNHKFWDRGNREWVALDDYPESTPMQTYGRRLTESGKAILAGMLMGDSSMTKAGLVRTTHGRTQGAYARHKADLFEASLILRKPNGFKRGEDQLNSSFAFSITELWPDWRQYLNGREKVSDWVIHEALSKPECLAYWYMDDGSLHTVTLKGKKYYYPTLHTEGFSPEACQRLADAIYAHTGVRMTYRPRPGGAYGFLRVVTRKDAEKWCSIVAPFIVPDMAYKLIPGTECPAIIPEAIQHNTFDAPFKRRPLRAVEKKTAYVGGRTPTGRYVRKPYTPNFSRQYCIEVEGTHSFFAEGVLTHNCIKHGCISLTVKENTVRQRQVLAGEVPLESLGASYEQDFGVDQELAEEIRASVSTRWHDPPIREAAEYALEEVLNGGARDRKGVLTTMALAFPELGTHYDPGERDGVEVAKFLLDWTGATVRKAWIDRRITPISQYDVARLRSRFSFLPDLIEVVGMETTAKLIAAFGGLSIRFPSISTWEKSRVTARAFEAWMADPSPTVLSAWAAKLRMPVAKLEETLTGWADNANAGVLEDAPIRQH